MGGTASWYQFHDLHGGTEVYSITNMAALLAQLSRTTLLSMSDDEL